MLITMNAAPSQPMLTGDVAGKLAAARRKQISANTRKTVVIIAFPSNANATVVS